MRGNYVILRIRLDAIRGFLECTDREAGAEIEALFQKRDAGEFASYEEFDSALSDPIMRQEIAARAVYYEITALVESELQASAEQPWLESDRHRGPKVLDWENLTLESIRSLKTIRDIRLNDLIRLIEDRYEVSVRELEGADIVFQIRDEVNAFKHRDGRIDFRKSDPTKYFTYEQYRADIEKAYQAIDQTCTFVRALWKATDREPLARGVEQYCEGGPNDDPWQP